MDAMEDILKDKEPEKTEEVAEEKTEQVSEERPRSRRKEHLAKEFEAQGRDPATGQFIPKEETREQTKEQTKEEKAEVKVVDFEVGESVTVIVAERLVRVLYAGQEVACHAQNAGRRTSIIERSHLVGIVGAHLVGVSWLARPTTAAPTPAAPAELLRPLAEYETALGGGW